MKTITSILLGATLASASLLAAAADNPLSVHILDLQSGKPTAGVGSARLE